ncbi:MAG: carboxylesterase family protein [Silvibacterium sp.]
MRPSLLLCLALVFLPNGLSAQPAPPHVRIAQGELVGEVTTMGPYAFKGIPYAAPPVGPLRWHDPQPPASWQGVRDATNYGPACMQQPSIFHILPSAMSEDCLYLNIWTSNLHPTSPAPVLVFIHGGGFVVGAGSQAAYDGANLAVRGAVIVTLNYRLGVFGFFAHPDLTAASPHHSSGNYGLLDQLAALRWVRRNIAAFGGDPHNVTVFGESAGAASIGYLMISPLAQGLFDKAILESPAVLFTATPELHKDYAGLSSMESIGLAVTPHIADLQSLSSTDLMDRADTSTRKFLGHGGNGRPSLSPETTLDNPSGMQQHWTPIVDGYVIPDQPAKLYAEGQHLRIPTMAGTNANEGNLFLTHYHPASTASFTIWASQTFAPCAKTVLGYYGPASPAQAHASADRLLTDALFLHSTFLFARDTHGYLYRFSHASPVGESTGLGAFHGSELPYVFGHTLASQPGRPPYQPIDHRLSDQIMTMWLHFARLGDPNLMNSSGWTRIGSNNEISYMDFGDTLAVKAWPDSALITFSDPKVCKSNQFASIR